MTSPALRFLILGPLQVVIDSEPIALPAKERTVLALLLTRANEIVSMDTLIEALWDEDPPAAARNTLQGHVKRLRQHMGKAGARIVTRAPGYLVSVADGELDLAEFIAASDRGRSAAASGDWLAASKELGEALAMWRGEPLADVPLATLQLGVLPRLDELRLKALETRIDADLGLGRHDELTPELRLLVSTRPLRERFWEQLMLALYRCDRQAEALEAFRHACDVLREGLGIDPGPGLQRLHQDILVANSATPDDLTLAPGLEVPAQLPPDTVDFTGRDNQVRLLYDLLSTEPDEGRPGAVVISAVAGMGGIGKTALAVHVAHLLRGRFPDGQLYVDLQGASNPLRPADVLGTFLCDLGVPSAAIPASEAARTARYRTALAARRMLIVLDDARDAAQLRPLLPGTAGSAVIVTSRGTLTDLAGAALMDLDVLGAREAESLFDAIVGPRRAAAEPEARAAVLAYCAGLPLAIRIAASRLASRPNWSIADLSAKLADERRRLAELTTGDLGVRISFAVSYEALSPGGMDPARLFRLLGLASMAVLSLPAIAALAGQPADEVSAALETLTDIHLVGSPAPEHFRLHDLLRDYAAELAENDNNQDDHNAALSRLFLWYAEQVTIAAQVLAPARAAAIDPGVHAIGSEKLTDPERVLAWCEGERPNLISAARRAAHLGMHDIAARIASETWGFFERTTHVADWLVMSQTGVSSARHLGNDAVLGRMLNCLGQVQSMRRCFEDSLRCFTEALAVLRGIGDRQGESMVLDSLAIDLFYQDRFEEALECLQSALAIHTALDDQWWAGLCLNNIGQVLVCLKRYDEALEHLRRALAIQRETSDRYGESITEGTLADTHLELGLFEEAVGHYRSALTAHQETAREHPNQANALCGLGDALARLGRTAEAHDTWQTALPILDRLADPRAAKIRERLGGPPTPAD
jgi:DNA-binding SARP family transcriptional activator/Flp pilus assembly protein TadD